MLLLQFIGSTMGDLQPIYECQLTAWSRGIAFPLILVREFLGCRYLLGLVWGGEAWFASSLYYFGIIPQSLLGA